MKISDQIWIPEQGDILYVGVPGVSLAPHEFIAMTSHGKFLVWNNDRTKALIYDRNFIYKHPETIEEGDAP